MHGLLGLAGALLALPLLAQALAQPLAQPFAHSAAEPRLRIKVSSGNKKRPPLISLISTNQHNFPPYFTSDQFVEISEIRGGLF